MYRSFLKRIFDFLAAVLGLLIISPLFILILITLSIVNNGRPFFFQERTGKSGKLFTIIKFKTMNDKTDKHGQLLPALERVTKMGDFCRKYSLDEFPQFINIIMGDMSLIGPRPLLPQYLPLYNERQNKRHQVLPGITGWAQVNGRNTISWEQKFEYDVFYVENLTFALDFQIIIKTIYKVIHRKDINSSENLNMPDFIGNEHN